MWTKVVMLHVERCLSAMQMILQRSGVEIYGMKPVILLISNYVESQNVCYELSISNWKHIQYIQRLL